MSTGLIIALIVIVAAVVVVAAALTLRARGGNGGRNLRRRFGPEYDHVLARHDGDSKAAEHELTERLERHGNLHRRPLEPAERERFEARWAAAQEHFVDSPREAVAEVDRLISEVAGARGFPDGDQYEEQHAALSVHHAGHVAGYRRVHSAATAGDGAGTDTEELRGAMLEARALFADLLRSDERAPVSHKAQQSHRPHLFQRHQVAGR